MPGFATRWRLELNRHVRKCRREFLGRGSTAQRRREALEIVCVFPVPEGRGSRPEVVKRAMAPEFLVIDSMTPLDLPARCWTLAAATARSGASSRNSALMFPYRVSSSSFGPDARWNVMRRWFILAVSGRLLRCVPLRGCASSHARPAILLREAVRVFWTGWATDRIASCSLTTIRAASNGRSTFLDAGWPRLAGPRKCRWIARRSAFSSGAVCILFPCSERPITARAIADFSLSPRFDLEILATVLAAQLRGGRESVQYCLFPDR
jgi:hypothetical protein